MLGSLSACVSDSPLDPAPQFPVVAGLAANPASGTAPVSVTFSAGSSSGGVAPLRYDFDFNGDGVIDSANGGPVAVHRYSAPGSFMARVVVTDAIGTSAEASVTVLIQPSANQPPVAQLSASSPSGTAPFSLSFDASQSSDSDGSVVRYDYDFDSNGIWDAYDAGPQVNWVYLAAGSYSARLRVTDDAGAQASTEVAISVNAAPQALLTASSLSASAGSTITFSAAGSNDPDGSIVKYEWDADGNGSFEQNTGSTATLQVLFPAAGLYTIRLRVTDDYGAQATAQLEVQIDS